MRITISALCGVSVAVIGFAAVAHAQSLDGTWDIVSVTDNGRVVTPADVQLNYAADSRVVISGQQVELVVPMTYQHKQLPFAVDASQSPMAFDLAGAEKRAGGGFSWPAKIHWCSAFGPNQGRPTTFASLPGSGNLFVSLRRATENVASSSRAEIRPELPGRRIAPNAGRHVGTSGLRFNPLHYARQRWQCEHHRHVEGSIQATLSQDVHSNGKWQVRNQVVTITIDSSSDSERHRADPDHFTCGSITGSELSRWITTARFGKSGRRRSRSVLYQS